MLQRIQKQMEDYQMVNKGECIAVAVSGGADSVCLLLLLNNLRKQMGFSLHVIHVEHGIRGKASKQDAEFVQTLCKTLEIPCVIYEVDACSYAKEKKMGLEEAARILRYEKFRTYALEQQAKIALAHHMEDNAETVLFQMLRGSSLGGLSGMLPVRKDEDGIVYIRPLLTIHREEIEDYLTREGQAFCTDATNLENEYSRNYLRNIVIPHLKNINSQAIWHIHKTATAVSEVREYMELEAKKQRKRLVKEKEGKWYLDAKQLEQLHPALQKQVVYEWIANVTGSKKDIASVHVEHFLCLIKAQSGKELHLPYHLIAKKEYNNIFLYKELNYKDIECKILQPQSQFFQIQISKEILYACENSNEPLLISLKESNETITLKIYQNTMEIQKIPKKTYTKWLDYDKIKQGFCIRTRQSGDYFINDMTGHRKKLKQYFIDEKIPAHKRNKIWLLAQESQIIWIVGGRISEHMKVTEDTKTIIEIQYNGGM